jgi:probable phosphoglycerate mutase
VRDSAGLREINCGRFEGQPLGEIRSRHPDLWQANLRQDDVNFSWPGGETLCLRRYFSVGCSD